MSNDLLLIFFRLPESISHARSSSLRALRLLGILNLTIKMAMQKAFQAALVVIASRAERTAWQSLKIIFNKQKRS